MIYFPGMFAEFPTTKTELNAVFDIFDREKRGLIDYKDFVDALKPDKVSLLHTVALNLDHKSTVPSDDQKLLLEVLNEH